LIYRAGSSYRLSAPYPMPTRDMFTVQMTPKMEGVSMKLVNTLGVEQKGEWGVVDGSENMSIWFDTRNVPSGTYHAVAYAGDEPIHTWTVTVFR